jgi:hypothetical protein
MEKAGYMGESMMMLRNITNQTGAKQQNNSLTARDDQWDRILCHAWQSACELGVLSYCDYEQLSTSQNIPPLLFVHVQNIAGIPLVREFLHGVCIEGKC